MGYRYLLVDNDNTLMDFSLAEHRAFKEAMRSFGLSDSDETAALYARINQAQWKALERGETTQAKLKVERYRLLLDALGVTGVDAAALSERYEETLGSHAELLPGAMALLETARAAGYRIALVTNGISRIQRSRLAISGFAHLLDAVIISAELGVSKPDPRLVEAALDQLGCRDKREAVLLGDSLTADIAAASNAGIDSIWLAHPGQVSEKPTHIVYSTDAAAVLLQEKAAPRFKAALFDLDGTLTDTLQDIADAMNHALTEHGLPPHETDRYRYMVGNGAAKLAERAVGPAADKQAAVFAAYSARYNAHKFDKTQPYAGIPELLAALKQAGLKLAVLSNKPHADTVGVVDRYFAPGTFDAVFGQREGVPIKPDPAAALAIANDLGVTPAECLYLGDTYVDMETAAGAGMTPVGVLWGFRDAEELLQSGARHLIGKPEELMGII